MDKIILRGDVSLTMEDALIIADRVKEREQAKRFEYNLDEVMQNVEDEKRATRKRKR